MIVKNESRIIERLLRSVSHIIDSFIICDTGSNDNTPEIITAFMNARGIVGEVFHKPFINFEHNRNEALQKAYESRNKYPSDFLLLLDADMILIVGDGFSKDCLTETDCVQILQGNESFSYKNTRLLRNNGQFTYRGVTHEYIDYPKGSRTTFIPREILFIEDIGDGGSKSDKFQRDIRLLLKFLETNPKDARTHFYLANSFKNLKNFDEAIRFYENRIKLGSWNEEIYISLYEMGICYKEKGDDARAIESWLRAIQIQPARVETLYELIKHYRWRGMNHVAVIFYDVAVAAVDRVRQGLVDRNNFLFVNTDIYDYLLDVENMIISLYVGRENIDASLINVLSRGSENYVNNVLSNLKFYKYIPEYIYQFNFDECFEKDGYSFVSSSSSVIPYTENTYIMNRRFVNYYIKEDGAYVSQRDKNQSCSKIITINEFVRLNERFCVIDSKRFEIGDTSQYYAGIEDVKIFKHRGVIHFMGTALRKDGRLGISYGEYKLDAPEIHAVELTPNWNQDFRCEKNWVFTEDDGELAVVYKWHPLVICKIDGDVLVKKRQVNTPAFLRRARGSTCGVRYKQEWFFVVHFVSYENPRHYYHAVVVLNDNLEFVRMGRIFSFEGQPIEYCLGLIVANDELTISYSTMDRTTRIKTYPLTITEPLNQICLQK